MSSIIEKLDSYQIMTNLLPGAFFGIALDLLLGMAIPFQGVVEEIVVYYFVSAKYCYATHELRLHQNDRCKRFTLV